MIIKYTFADGTVSEVEVDEAIGSLIIEYRQNEENLSRNVTPPSFDNNRPMAQ